LLMNIFLILLGQTKEIFVWKRQELFSAGNWPVKNSSCLQIYFQVSDTGGGREKKADRICAEDRGAMTRMHRPAHPLEERREERASACTVANAVFGVNTDYRIFTARPVNCMNRISSSCVVSAALTVPA
jgi:hypothetical protein